MLMQSIKNKIMEVDKIFFLANSDTNFINIMHSLEKNVEIATLKNRMIATSIMVTNAVFETMPELIE
ncbi:MAG: hypothetical protein LBH96_02650 [Candidatus Peribacteria bacterium]|jgi:hypothetical protein|nr:hypothetical protein [Candidatus Peribacteria bacterium]